MQRGTDEQRASPWRSSTARRLSLAVRSSISSLSRPPHAQFFKDHGEDESSSMRQNTADRLSVESPAQNIDQALRSLYSTEVKQTLWTQLQNSHCPTTTATTAISYIPTQDFDWMLDEPHGATDKVVSESKEWIAELEKGGDRRLCELEQYIAQWEDGLQSAFEFESSESGDATDQESIQSNGDSEDDGFGEFQSASDENNHSKPIVEADLRTTVLVNLAESLLMKNQIRPEMPHCNSPLTPDLLERSEHVVAEHLRDEQMQCDRGDSGTFTNEDSIRHQRSDASNEDDNDDDVSVSYVEAAYDAEHNLPSFIDLPSPVPASMPLVARGVHDRPISLKLPWHDYSTSEGRFLRRRQQMFFEDNNEVLGLKQHDDDSGDDEIALTTEDQDRCIRRLQEEYNLPGYYFTNPDIDDGIKLLGSLPWHNLMALYSKSEGITENSDIAVWDEHMATELSRLDAALEELKKVSLQQVQPHQSELLRANYLIHDLDQNIRLAEMYRDRCQDALQAARGEEHECTGMVGSMIVLEAFDKRKKYRELDDLLQSIKNANQSLNDIYNSVNALSFQHRSGLSDYETIIDHAESLRKNLSKDRLGNVRALDSLRSRIENIGEKLWLRLETLCQSAIVRLCRRAEFDSVGHKRLLDVCLDVSKRYSAALPDGMKLGSWYSEQIGKSFCYETERALAIALVDPAYDVVPSEFSKDLDELGDEIDLNWGDRHKLRNVIQNLITIRFGFEGSLVNYLPGVMRKLFGSIRAILAAFLVLMKWHFSPDADTSCRDRSDDLKLCFLSQQLKAIKQQVWDNCENVIVRCLDGYLTFRARQTLFDCNEHGIDERAWLEDLKSLCIVYALTDRFVSQKQSFFGSAAFSDDIATLAERGNVLVDRLGDVFRRHLKAVHVEAMNASGRKLANESWVLQAFNGSLAGKSSSVSSLQTGPSVAQALEDGFCFYEVNFTFLAILNELDFSLNEESLPSTSIQIFEKFDAVRVEHESAPRAFPGIRIHSDCPFLDRFHDEIDDRGSLSRVAPDYVTSDFLQWLARLLTVLKCFPLIAEDVSAAVANLGDLYCTTILRLCAGSARNEKFLLGICSPNPFQNERDDETQQKNIFSGVPAGNNFLDSFRKGRRPSRSSIHTRMVSSTLDAEICEPLLSDSAAIFSLRRFILRAQESLKGVVDLDKVDVWMRQSDDIRPSFRDPDEDVCEACRLLEKRVSGALSLYAVASVTAIFHDIATTYIGSCPIGSRFLSNLESLQRYSSAFVSVAPTLVHVSMQIACQRAMNGYEIVTSMTCNEAAWEESKLNEEPNDYVESICERCALFWGFLSTSGKLPDKAMISVWSSLLTAAYSSMLEGFSRISFCSTEGRALMALDLASFSSGVTPQAIKEILDRRSFSAKPVHRPPVLLRGMAYVDTYIKVYYYPDKDALDWIRNNYKRYRSNHILALRIATNQGDASRLWKEELADLYGCGDEQL